MISKKEDKIRGKKAANKGIANNLSSFHFILNW